LGSVQSADIQLIKTKAAAAAPSNQANKQASRPTDRVPLTKPPPPATYQHYFYSTGQTHSRVNQYPPTGSAN